MEGGGMGPCCLSSTFPHGTVAAMHKDSLGRESSLGREGSSRSIRRPARPHIWAHVYGYIWAP
jgi:hypothetical protein